VTRLVAILGTCTLLASLACVGVAPAEPGGDEWKYDVVVRRKGPALKGLVVKQNAEYVTIKCINRNPGRPTIIFEEAIPRRDVDHVYLLDPKERDVLVKRIDAVRKERELLAGRLKLLEPGSKAPADAGDVVYLKPTEWPPNKKTRALSYRSAQFELISTAQDELVQYTVIMLESAYIAYEKHLPPRHPKANPTTILLTRTMSEYLALVRDQGVDFFNPAFFDVAHNRILCGSDLYRLCEEVEECREYHAKLLVDLAKEEEALRAAFKGKEKALAEFLQPIEEKRKSIPITEKRNIERYHQARDRFFHRLYHEAFHAYLNTFVYSPDEAEVPRWLNEGLAQIFETAVVEAGELRVGHVDRERGVAIRQALARDTLVPVADLLRSGPQQFLVAHAAATQAADRQYLASWGLAFYLTFERKLLGTKVMDEYVTSLKRGADPLMAFETLVGQPLAAFEKDYLNYLKKLDPK
jgi:hypothetical protein